MSASLLVSLAAFGMWPPFPNCLTVVDSTKRVGYAMTFWTSEQGQRIGWRVSLALSLIPGVPFLIGLPFMHDS